VAADGYSIAEQLEQLMVAAGESPPLLTPDEHAEHVPSLATPDAENALSPPIDPASVPRPSVGQVLSAPGVDLQEPPAMPEGAAVPVLLGTAHVDVPDYALVAPVELHFTEGGARLGVRAGTRTYAEFQRLAGILLGDLKAGRDL
jgi:hypothetical protein